VPAQPRRAERPDAQSLALVRPRQVDALEITAHPGWTPEQQQRIDAYADQPGLFGSRDRTPLEAPRLRGSYRYRCHSPGCGGHRQGLLEWESRDVAFYVGNQAKRPHVFSVLGVYYPQR
jgi:hypothetical protein